MSEVFPAGSIKKLEEAVELWHKGKDDEAGKLVAGILLEQDLHRRTTIAPEMSIGILQAYLKAVAVFPVDEGKTVADLLKEQDHKLWFALQTAGVG